MAGPGSGWMFEPGSLDFPLVIAHRGAHSAHPQNTIAAFQAALALGVDGVELDVRLTGDGLVAVVHDRAIEVGVGRRAVVGRIELAEVNEMRTGAGLPTLLTLEAVFAALPSSFLVDVELKVRSPKVGALTTGVVEAIRATDRLETTLVKSHNPLAVRRLRTKYPDVTRGYIWGRSHPWPLRTRRFRTVPDAHWIAPSEDSYDRGLLEGFHALGRRVLAWDVDVADPAALTGIDAVMTDDPGRLVRLKADVAVAGVSG